MMTSSEPDNEEVADVLSEIGRMLDLQNENQYRVRAYENAARTIESLREDVSRLVEEDRLTEVEGIGDTLAEKITELVTTGSLAFYEQLREEIPAGLLEMMKIQGLGPRKVDDIRKGLDITTIEELEAACRAGKIQELDGFGSRTEENILKGIEHLKKYRARHLVNEAMEAAEPFQNLLEEHPKVTRHEQAGSLRRHCESIGDVDLLASVEPPDRMDVRESFLDHDRVKDVLGTGETKISVRLDSGIQVDLRLVNDREFPFALHYFTGSKQHNVQMRQIAMDQDLKLNEYGLFPADSEDPTGEDRAISCETEEELFEALGLHFIPPELREGQGEIEHARNKPIPDLVELSDLEGILHMHTTWSDGTEDLRDMIEETRQLGYSYAGITDHSKTARYAGGLTRDEAIEQIEEMERLQDEMEGIDILKGIEADILRDGSLDYDDDLLDRYDFVIASIHEQLSLDEETQTRRLLEAIRNPHTSILGHPTGRLLLSREGYNPNLETIIDEAAHQGTAIEINSNPQRLDLDWRWMERAKEQSVDLVITPDAHSLDGLQQVRWGVGIARKGGLRAEDVLNTKKSDVLRDLF